jgi:hypothetical protein
MMTVVLKKILILCFNIDLKNGLYLKQNNTFCKYMQNIGNNISDEYGNQGKSYLVLTILI